MKGSLTKSKQQQAKGNAFRFVNMHVPYVMATAAACALTDAQDHDAITKTTLQYYTQQHNHAAMHTT
jgi:hypothetical protein